MFGPIGASFFESIFTIFTITEDQDKLVLVQSIDNSIVEEQIRKQICDILEGGEPAFRARAKKYRINFNPRLSEL